MPNHITKIKLHNFKKFTDFELELDSDINIFVGDNDAGKSSILAAVDLVLNASASKISTVGYESLLNAGAVQDFLSGDRTISRLPIMWAEVYLSPQDKEELEGKNNSDDIKCEGLRLEISPSVSMPTELNEFLSECGDTFPFEYYQTNFTTFSGEQYSGYKKYLRSVTIDNTRGNDDFALSHFVKNAYDQNLLNQQERARHHASYRAMKTAFTTDKLHDLNERIEGAYTFQLRTSSKSNLDTDLSITENGIAIENYGKGQQVVMKAEVALSRSEHSPDIVLIEEPENHLSHINMNKLIKTIKSNSGQLLISTHSNLVSSRLDLRHCVLVNSNTSIPLKLTELTDDTSDYFMKAPPHDVLDFTLSKKVILVEGAAEYILMKKFYESVQNVAPEQADVHIISVGGTSFRRYLEIAKILNIKTAVIRDNDGDGSMASIYDEWISDEQKVFIDTDTSNRTFEVSFYKNNTDFCETLFSSARRSITVQDFMLKNKSDAAFEILKNIDNNIVVPPYISEAIIWISE